MTDKKLAAELLRDLDHFGDESSPDFDLYLWMHYRDLINTMFGSVDAARRIASRG